ncbi:MAG: tryptophan synthase subunit alpha [Candidatus Krumholzibacteria bacterium]|nr:tryptophan synthase subunit alpha [Candidatus Krumholzibacteria bacterium]
MKLHQVTHALKERGRKALVAFFTAGYPDEKTFLDLVWSAHASGCDVIEIGIPFSDPIADGPLIQTSSKRALDNGMSLRHSLELAADIAKEITTPIVLMSYYNPILRMGDGHFAELASAAGVAGVIVPDLPLEESDMVRSALKSRDIVYVDLIAPTSNDDRIEAIADEADGFLYLVSVTGVTGVRSPISGEISSFVARVRAATDLPLYVGFGISDIRTAKAAVAHSDGVIIGSALIRLIESAASNSVGVRSVHAFLAEVKAAIESRAGRLAGRSNSRRDRFA